MTAGTSAVIAAYNHEQYVAEAVIGLAHQVDEVIVVDDRSSDATGEVVRSLALPNVTLLTNEKQLGVSLSFNRAVDAARYDVVLIQGGDDRSLPGRAAYQAAVLADPDVMLTCSLPVVINERGQELPDEVGDEFRHGPDDGDDLGHLLFRGNFICAPSVALRRDDYRRLGGFQNGIDLLQDYLLWLRLTEVGRIDVSSSPVVEYRKHSSNTSREYVGLDAPRQRRLDAELAYCRVSFLETASRHTRERLAGTLGLPHDSFQKLDDLEQVAVLQLSHPDKVIVRRGLDFAFTAAGAPDFERRLARLGLAIGDLGRLAQLADHENRSAVERATLLSTTLHSE